MDTQISFFSRFIKRLLRKKHFFFIPFFLVLILFLTYGIAQKSFYTSKALLKIDDPFGIDIKSDPILSRALTDYNVARKSEPALSLPDLKKILSVNFNQKSGNVELSITSGKATDFSDLLNGIANIYVSEVAHKAEGLNKEVLKNKGPAIREHKNNLEAEAQKAKEHLEESERRLAKFKSEDEKISLKVSYLKERLLSLESERANLLRVYTNLHPEVVRIDSELSGLQKEMDSMPPRPTGGFELENELDMNQRTYAAINEKWEAIRFKDIEELVAPKKTYSVISRAKRPQPVFDPKQMARFMLAGLIAALFLGFVIISIAVFSDTSIATPEEMSSFSKLPVAGIIPYIDKKSPLLLENEGCADMVDSYRRLYAHIYSDIFAETLNGKIILLTSAIPREGKSIIAANLSLVMARAGKKSLLIDFNFERPYIHKLFGIDSKSPGLTDILARGTSLDSALMSVTDMLLGNMEMGKALGSKGLDKLNIIIAGRPLSMAGELLHSDKIEKLLQDLKNRFDIIILDGPSVSESVDGIILASKCDAALMAYSAGKKPTPRSYLKSAINSLAKSGSLKGVIITRCI